MTSSLIPPSGILKMWCDLYSPKSEAPVEGHLGAAIALVSCAIGYKVPLTFVRNTEPCTVNVILEGESALGRKTTTANTARALARRAVDLTIDDPGLLVHPVGHTSGAGLLELVAPKNEEQARRWDEITPPGHLLVWDEFGSLLGDPGQNRKSGDWLGQVRTTIMSLTNGWHSGSKTRKDPLNASRCSVSILATMTRDELEQRVSTGLLHDGFLGRFALIRMSRNGKLLAIPPRFTQAEEHQEDYIVTWLRELAFRRTAWGDPFDMFTSAAVDARTTWYAERNTWATDNTAGDADFTAARAAAFGRLQALAVKVAAVHAVCRLDNPAQDDLTIDAADVEYGQLIADMCLEEISELAAMSGPAADQYAEKVGAYLERNSGFASKRDLLRHVKYRNLDSSHRWRIVESMHPDTVIIEAVKGKPGPKSLTARLANWHQNGHPPTGAKPVESGARKVTDD